MNYQELKAAYLKNFKIGAGISFLIHFLLLSFLLIIVPGNEDDVNNGYKEKFTYIDLYQLGDNVRPPGITEEEGGGGGKSSRISGTPVPTKEKVVTKEFDPAAPAKGDSTKSGTGGSGSGTGVSTGYVPPPVIPFRKSDYLIAVEMQPEPLGGYAAIDKKVIVPETAKKNGITGKVFIQAYINENGEVVFAEVLKGLGSGCDEAALRAVKVTRFKAGKQGGRYVKVQMSIPVNFY